MSRHVAAVARTALGNYCQARHQQIAVVTVKHAAASAVTASSAGSEFRLMALLCMLSKTKTHQTAKISTSSMVKRLDLVARIAPRIFNFLGSARAHDHTSPGRKTPVEDVDSEFLTSEICKLHVVICANFRSGNYYCSFIMLPLARRGVCSMGVCSQRAPDIDVTSGAR